MFDNDVVFFFFVRDTEVAEEGIGRLTHDHGREELAAEPCTAAFSRMSEVIATDERCPAYPGKRRPR